MSKKKIIGIVSCKGGVGKTTLSINLSSFLSCYYYKNIGLLDADINGPNHSRFLGINKFNNFKIFKNKIIPNKKYNLYSISMSYFLKKQSSVLLRGPMLSNTLNYLYNNTDWPNNLDFLIIDFPPGTGDIYLSFLRDVNFLGVYLVTTSHDISLDDTKKSIYMLKKFNINILGILENMCFFKCHYCKNINYFNFNNNIKSLVNEFNILEHYKLPFYKFISQSSDSGIPFIFYNKCIDFSYVIKNICKNLI